VAEKMSEEMIKVWQSFLSRDYDGKESDILAALIATLFGKGVLTREEVDSLKEMLRPKGEPKSSN
jgi:hypothetical protein